MKIVPHLALLSTSIWGAVAQANLETCKLEKQVVLSQGNLGEFCADLTFLPSFATPLLWQWPGRGCWVICGTRSKRRKIPQHPGHGNLTRHCTRQGWLSPSLCKAGWLQVTCLIAPGAQPAAQLILIPILIPVYPWGAPEPQQTLLGWVLPSHTPWKGEKGCTGGRENHCHV